MIKTFVCTKKFLSWQQILEQKIVINFDKYHEIISEKDDFYKVKSEFEKKLNNFKFSGIEWRPLNLIKFKQRTK